MTDGPDPLERRKDLLESAMLQDLALGGGGSRGKLGALELLHARGVLVREGEVDLHRRHVDLRLHGYEALVLEAQVGAHLCQGADLGWRLDVYVYVRVTNDYVLPQHSLLKLNNKFSC